MPAVSHADIITNLTSFNRHLWAENLSPRTIETYCESVRQFVRFPESQGMPLKVANLRREHVESFVEHLLVKFARSTSNGGEVLLALAEAELRPALALFSVFPVEQVTRDELRSIEARVSDGFKISEPEEALSEFLIAADLELASTEIRDLNDPLVPKALGYAYLRTENLQESIRQYKRAILRDPEDEEARKGLVYAEALAQLSVPLQ